MSDDEERTVAVVPVAGFHASSHDAVGISEVHLTTHRFVALSSRGLLKKRLEEVASWPHRAFTSRVNSNEGTALGPFLYVVTLFTHDDETVSTAFRTEEDRDTFKLTVGQVIAVANGW